MSIHRAKKKRCTLCRPAKGFRKVVAVKQHTRRIHPQWKKNWEEVVSNVARAFGGRAE